MPLARDHSDLPRAKATKEEGWPPDKVPRFVDKLAERWLAEAQAQGPKPRARPELRFRHSDAGGCSRAIAYAALDVPESNPIDQPAIFVMNIGSWVHEQLQEELNVRYGMDSEVVCVIDGFEGSGHLDGELKIPFRHADSPVQPNEGKRVVSEYKVVDGYAFKLAVGERGAPKGPRWSYVVQGALNALARNADELVVGLLSKGAIGIPTAKRKGFGEIQRYCAEWTLTRQQFEPIALEEMERVNGILTLIDTGLLPQRKIPDPELPKLHLITEPARGIWVELAHPGVDTIVNSGTTWQCDYCRYQDTCSMTKPGRTPTDVLVQLGLIT